MYQKEEIEKAIKFIEYYKEAYEYWNISLDDGVIFWLEKAIELLKTYFDIDG